MKPLEKTANDLFQHLRARFSPVTIGDENAEVTNDPSAARFFSFTYEEDGKSLGTVSLSIISNRSLKIYFSHEMVNRIRNDTDWYNLLKDLRFFAKRNMLSFDARDIQKDQLDTRDFEFIKQHDGPYKDTDVEITESSMYGSKRKSMQKFENATLVVYHKQTVDEEKRGARSRHIDSIFIESNHERFRFPINYLNGARAMAVHVSEGGTPYDAIGQHIVSTVTEMQNLAKFARMTRRHAMEDAEASEIRDRVIETYHGIKRDIMRMQNVNNYRSFAENFTPTDASGEADVTTLQEKFTRKVWNEQMNDLLPSVQRALQATVNEGSTSDMMIDAAEMSKEEFAKKYPGSAKDYETLRKRQVDEADIVTPQQRADMEQRMRNARRLLDHVNNEMRYHEDAINNIQAAAREKFGPDWRREEEHKIADRAIGRHQDAYYLYSLARDRLKKFVPDVKKAMKHIQDANSHGMIAVRHNDFIADKYGVEGLDESLRTVTGELEEASSGVENSIKNSNFALVLKKDDAADAMIRTTKFTKADGLLAYIMSDIASRIIGNDADEIANFASNMAEKVGNEGASFGTKMTPDYKRDKQLAMMLAKKYLDDLKRMATDSDYADTVRKDPADVYGGKKKRAGGYHEAVDTFESWANEVLESSEYTAEATTVGTAGITGTQPARTNPQVIKALSGGDAAKARQLKAVSDKLARGQRLTPQEQPLAGEIAKGVTTTKKPMAAMQALAQDKHTKIDEKIISEKTLKVKAADADYDGDGEIESPEEEYMGSRDRAIKRAKHTKMEGDEELMKESLALLKRYAGL